MTFQDALDGYLAVYGWARDFVQSPTLLEYTKLLADLVKSIAWPAAISMAVLYFRNEIRPIIERITKFGPGGIELGPRAADKQGQDDIPSPATLSTSDIKLKDLPGVSRSEARAELEIKLKEALRQLQIQGKVTPENETDFLINELASTRLAALFSRIYYQIFGSQIKGLIHLNQHYKSTIDEARKLYQESKDDDPKFYADYSFDAWLGFLVESNLIKIEGDDIKITALGREFLTYLHETRLSHNKRG